MPDYRPWTNRYVGIEMEMNPRTTDGTSLTQSRVHTIVQGALPHVSVAQVGYSHSNGSRWEVKTDSSCGGNTGNSGFEVVSPKIMLDDEGDNMDLKSVCHALKTANVAVNRQCGLHVHIEVRDFSASDLRRLIALWTRYEPFFFEMLPASRSRNTYCPPMRKTTWDGTSDYQWPTLQRALNANTEDEFLRTIRSYASERYRSLNLDHFWSRSTIEFRLHSGTVDYEKIRNWTKLLLALVNRCKQGFMPEIANVNTETRTGFNTYYVCKVLGLIKSKFQPTVPASNRALVDWIDARRTLFSGATMPRTGRRSSRVANAEASEVSA